METSADRLRRARIAAGFDGPGEAALRHHWNVNTYKSNENGNATFSFKKAKEYAEAFRVRPEWLYDGLGEMRAVEERVVPIIGRVGADADGSVILGAGDQGDELVPAPPGGSDRAAALLVRGTSMPGVVEDGALLYFEHQRTPPTEEMLGKVVVLETEDHRVLVKRLLRGAKRNTYDLESIAGEPIRGVRLRWAAEIIANIPAAHARKLLRERVA